MDNEEYNMIINKEITDGKVYICEHCGIATTWLQAIKLHMQKHLDKIEETRNTPGVNWREYEFFGKEI